MPPTDVDAPITFEAPGPGAWLLDPDHVHLSLPLLADGLGAVTESALADCFDRVGSALDRPDVVLVEGRRYRRLHLLGESRGWLPRTLAWRVLPALRRRDVAARAAIDSRIWRCDLARWLETDRPRLVAELRGLGALDLSGFDDARLAAHVAHLAERFAVEAGIALRVHSDLVAVGGLLVRSPTWGIDGGEVLAWLRHAMHPVHHDDGPPDRPVPARSTPDVDALRRRVPAGQRVDFDALVAEAEVGVALRHDIGRVRGTWMAWLVRRALLEVGGRLVERGSLPAAPLALELSLVEVRSVLDGDGRPDATTLTARRTRRLAVDASEPPVHLGEGGGPRMPRHLPAAVGRVTRSVMAALDAGVGSEAAPGVVIDLRDGLDLRDAELRDGDLRNAGLRDDGAGAVHGIGVGSGVYEGRACVADDVADAWDRLQPGDVLVVPFTSPAYNSLFPLVGAVVTDQGGAQSHTAIMAREFGVPGVVGAHGATRLIPDGRPVRVDAEQGRVVALVPAGSTPERGETTGGLHAEHDR